MKNIQVVDRFRIGLSLIVFPTFDGQSLPQEPAARMRLPVVLLSASRAAARRELRFRRCGKTKLVVTLVMSHNVPGIATFERGRLRERPRSQRQSVGQRIFCGVTL